MKNILLGVLLVVLAAVVVNKKMWKHRTFLMLVVGILVAMMAVSMFGGKESFQTSPSTSPCTSTSITFYRDITSGTPTSANDYANGSGNEIVVWNDIMTNTNATFAVTNTGTSPYSDIALRKWCYLLGRLSNSGCYDRMLSFFAWAMANHSLIFTPGLVASTYKGPAINTNSNDRYMNFVELVKQYKTILFDSNGNVEYSKTAPYFLGRGNMNSTNMRFINFHIYRLMALYIQLRAKVGSSGDMIKYMGMWLDRVQNFSLVSMAFTFNTGVHFLNRSISRMLGAIVGGASVCSSSAKITSGIGASTEFLQYFTSNPAGGFRTFVNRIPGFIYDACIPNDMNYPIIQTHSTYLSILFLGLLIIKNTYEYKNRDYTSTMKITARMAEIKPIMESIVMNVNADEYIEKAAIAKGLTPLQLDTLMRNYLGDEKCTQPLTTDKILNVINTNTAGYSNSVLSANAISTLGSTFADITNMLRAAIFKSNLDTQNQSWLGGWNGISTGVGASDNQLMPLVEVLASVKPPRAKNIEMLDYIFGTGALPTDYFNGLYTRIIYGGYWYNAIFDGNLSDFVYGLRMLANESGTVQTSTNCVSLPLLAPAPA